MENLPGDVLLNVFIRLLAKQLAQMRCVCKPWNTLLSQPSFIRSHLDRSIHKNEDILLFFHKELYIDSSPGPLTARSSRSPHLELTNYMKLKLPVHPQHKHKIGYSNVIGSVNGLICFYYASNNYKDRVICIWNPSLSAVLTLPPFPLSIYDYHLAFGFDPKTDDYKVVKLPSNLRASDMITQPHGAIYSMRKGSWEIISLRVPSHIKWFNSRNDQGCLDGHLHWLCVTDLKSQTIVTLDLGAETFREIPLPDCITYEYHRRGKISLGVLGGKLCVMSDILLGECEVWVMNEDESWMKHDVFSQFNEDITPCGFTSHGEFLFRVLYDCRFALYDPIAATTKIFKIKKTRELDSYKFIKYIDSLVWMSPVNRLQI